MPGLRTAAATIAASSKPQRRVRLVRRSLSRATAGWLIALLVPASAAATITEFPLPTRQSTPTGITAGPDGALWFTEQGSGLGQGSGRIGRITTSGSVTEFPIPSPGSLPTGITTGPDGALWFTEQVAGIGRISTSGSVTEFPISAADNRPFGIASGPDGALWFTDALNGIGRVTTTGTFSEFPIPTTCCGPSGITAGPDGALWFAESLADFRGEIDRITTDGDIAQFPIPTVPSQPAGVTVGSDGALWFADTGGNSIGRVTTDGSFSEFPIRTPNSGPVAITGGPDGAIWFAETAANKIGRITTTGIVTDFRLRTPASVPTGIAAGSDGALWFTEQAGNRIGRITTDQPLEDSIDGTLFTQAPCDPPQIGCTRPRYVIGASSGPSGEQAFGTLDFVIGERVGTVVDPGVVTCLLVEGNRAAVGVNFEFPPDATAPDSQSALAFFEDNGAAGQDRFAVQALPGRTAPSSCPAGPPPSVELGPGFPPAGAVEGPGVVINDVQAQPKTKADCRHGGYARFGFKSQGRCIAFVVHQAFRACRAERDKIGRAAFRRKYGGDRWPGIALLNCVRSTTGP
jgi:virginiamycin B lyase